ncbi:hypothetical protein F4861DRAFT_396613 [Xylaria intraflava]|nr:hypothetical protein F4861DRAFT_396613 [Xylaria intraflava]
MRRFRLAWLRYILCGSADGHPNNNFYDRTYYAAFQSKFQSAPIIETAFVVWRCLISILSWRELTYYHQLRDGALTITGAR